MARKNEDIPREIPFSDFRERFEIVDDREDGRVVAVECDAADQFLEGIEELIARDVVQMERNEERVCPGLHSERERRRLGSLVQGTPLTPKLHKRL